MRTWTTLMCPRTGARGRFRVNGVEHSGSIKCEEVLVSKASVRFSRRR